MRKLVFGINYRKAQTLSLENQNNIDRSYSTYISKGFTYYYNWFDFAGKYNTAIWDSMLEASNLFLESENKMDWRKTSKKLRLNFDLALRKRLNSEDVTSSLSKSVDSWLDVLQLMDYNKQFNPSYFISVLSRFFYPLRHNEFRTPSEIINLDGEIILHHYTPEGNKKYKTPILFVYSLINRYYILDLMPDVSVINNLRKQGFDVYAISWSTPDYYKESSTLENFSYHYLNDAVDKIKKITDSEKISLFGYCWGGIFSLVYSAIHPEKVKNLVLQSTPVDLSDGGGLVDNWTANLNTDKLVDTLGNIPGGFVNLAFILRNPFELFLKYSTILDGGKTLNDLLQFFWIETWLYDSKPIIGEAYREIIKQIYQENNLMKNKMKVGKRIIDLSKITLPVLNIVGSKDDLVPPQTSKSITSVLGNKQDKLIEFPTGHVGLCISQKAHDQLWPEVGKWLAQRS